MSSKKHQLIVKVESIASSSKKLWRVEVKTAVLSSEKNTKSTRIFNKNSCDLFTAITHTNSGSIFH